MHYQSRLWLFVVQEKKKKKNIAEHRSKGKKVIKGKNHFQDVGGRFTRTQRTGNKQIQNLFSFFFFSTCAALCRPSVYVHDKENRKKTAIRPLTLK